MQTKHETWCKVKHGMKFNAIKRFGKLHSNIGFCNTFSDLPFNSNDCSLVETPLPVERFFSDYSICRIEPNVVHPKPVSCKVIRDDNGKAIRTVPIEKRVRQTGQKRKKRVAKIVSTHREQLRQVSESFKALGVAEPCKLIRQILRRSASPDSTYGKGLWRADCFEVLSEVYTLLVDKPNYAKMPVEYLARLAIRVANKTRAQWVKFISADTLRRLASRIKVSIEPDRLKSQDRLDGLLAILGAETVKALLSSRTIAEASDKLGIDRVTLQRRLAKARTYIENTKRKNIA